MTENPQNQVDINKRARQIFLSISVGWTAIVVGLCILTYSYHVQTAMDVALNLSMNSFEKDVVYRKWAAIHGGVYVPISEYIRKHAGATCEISLRLSRNPSVKVCQAQCL